MCSRVQCRFGLTLSSRCTRFQQNEQKSRLRQRQTQQLFAQVALWPAVVVRPDSVEAGVVLKRVSAFLTDESRVPVQALAPVNRHAHTAAVKLPVGLITVVRCCNKIDIVDLGCTLKVLFPWHPVNVLITETVWGGRRLLFMFCFSLVLMTGTKMVSNKCGLCKPLCDGCVWKSNLICSRNSFSVLFLWRQEGCLTTSVVSAMGLAERTSMLTWS